MKAPDAISKLVSRSAGFTLIELMVVIIIIGMLIAIVGPGLMGRTDEAGVVAAKAQIKGFQTAILDYKMKFKKMPASLGELVRPPSGGSLLAEDNLPKDPWDRDYVYTYPGANGRPYDIVSYGPDGQAGTADDIESWNLSKAQPQN